MDKATIYVGCPIWRYYDVRAAHSAMSAFAIRDDIGGERIYFETIDGDALISRTRSQLATKFLTDPELDNADVMVILDDDVQYNPEDFHKIVRGAREKQAPYGGIYVTRSRKPHPAALRWPEQTITFDLDAEPVSIRYLATGFMAFPRKVLEEMLNKGEMYGPLGSYTPNVEGFRELNGTGYLDYCTQGVGEMDMWDFFRPFKIDDYMTLREAGYEAPDEVRVHYLSEDWAFCERARQCGYEVWADPSIYLQHRTYVSVTVFDLNEDGFMLSEQAPPGKGSQSLITSGPELGSAQEAMATR